MKKFYCIECNREKSKIGLKCLVCAGKQTSLRQKGKNNPNWQGGWKNNLPNCLDCGKTLCKECHRLKEIIL